jgi:hypothetical protein
MYRERKSEEERGVTAQNKIGLALHFPSPP